MDSFNPKIERVARAIYEAGKASLQSRRIPTTQIPWAELTAHSRWTWIAAANAAILAMEEPDSQ